MKNSISNTALFLIPVLMTGLVSSKVFLRLVFGQVVLLVVIISIFIFPKAGRYF